MKILFDQGTPVPLRKFLPNHNVDTVYEMGWAKLSNGELLDEAERNGYDVLITTDQNLKHQQNLRGNRPAIIVLLTTSWPCIRKQLKEIRTAVENISPCDYKELPVRCSV